MNRTRIVLQAVFLTVGGMACIGLGYWLSSTRPSADASPEASHDAQAIAADDDHAEEVEHVAISPAAAANLDLQLVHVLLSDHTEEVMLPGMLVPLPGIGRRIISAPVSGVVTSIQAKLGQLVGAGTPLMELELNDNRLADSQKTLLETVAQLSVLNRELARLQPLSDVGAVAGRRLRDLAYEQEQLMAKQRAYAEAAELYGASRAAIRELLETGTLIRTTTVTMTKDGSPHEGVDAGAEAAATYTVEELSVNVGQAVERGQPLCTVANYAQLLVRATAFESDLEMIRRLQVEERPIAIEIGHDQFADHRHITRRDDLRISYIEPSIEQDSQSLHFFLPLENEAVAAGADDEVGWQFRPGQRVHVRIPSKTWQQVLVVPLSALVEEGAESFVFRQLDDHHDAPPGDDVGPDHADHDHDHDHDHDSQEPLEFQPLPVRVLHRGDQFAVLAEATFDQDDLIVTNNAYQLHLAMKVAAGAGQAHDHHH